VVEHYYPDQRVFNLIAEVEGVGLRMHGAIPALFKAS
jgi:hypothetical protein